MVTRFLSFFCRIHQIQQKNSKF